jgi:organic hydroperoxide reductase OsmC/OhrA
LEKRQPTLSGARFWNRKKSSGTARRGDSYEDPAVGHVTKNERGVPWVSTVTLSPRIAFSGTKQPTAEQLDHLHHQAHEQCFIANSVKTDIRVQSVS